MDLKADEAAAARESMDLGLHPGKVLLAAAVGGLLIGIVGAAFRYLLTEFDAWRPGFYAWTHALGWWGILIPVVSAAGCAALARFFVRCVPLASGSGVQYAEALARGEIGAGSFWILPVKFVGGLIAIGLGGLALGREGPTIQMGSVIGSTLAKKLRLGARSLQDLQAGLGGAGLAVAFNAPLAGALFVFEEVAKKFELRLTLITLIGVSFSIAVMRLTLGDRPDFVVPAVSPGGSALVILSLVLGLLLGVLGALYNRTTLGLLAATNRLAGLPVEARAAAVGAVIGLLGWAVPTVIGGGDTITQSLFLEPMPLLLLVGFLAIRWIIAPLSYATGVPGGIFSPLLLVGVMVGFLFAGLVNPLLAPAWRVDPVALAVVGMAAFFSAVVRAPLTGIALIAEMTATNNLLPPMLAGCFGAAVAATFMGSLPIYDSLRIRMLASGIAPEPQKNA